MLFMKVTDIVYYGHKDKYSEYINYVASRKLQMIALLWLHCFPKHVGQIFPLSWQVSALLKKIRVKNSDMFFSIQQ